MHVLSQPEDMEWSSECTGVTTADEEEVRSTNQQQNTTSSDEFPRLSPLPDLDLTSEFSATLQEIMTYHQACMNGQPDEQYDSFMPSFEIITRQSIHPPLTIWCPLLNESAMRLFFHHFKIQEHLEHAHRYFLFGDPVFSSGISRLLFGNNTDDDTSVYAGILLFSGNNQWPPQASELNMALRSLMLESISMLSENVTRDLCAPFLSEQNSLINVEDLVAFGMRQGDSNSPWNDPRSKLSGHMAERPDFPTLR